MPASTLLHKVFPGTHTQNIHGANISFVIRLTTLLRALVKLKLKIKEEKQAVVSFNSQANRLVPHSRHSVTLSTPLFGSTTASWLALF